MKRLFTICLLLASVFQVACGQIVTSPSSVSPAILNGKVDNTQSLIYFKEYWTASDLANDFTISGFTTAPTVDANGHIVLTGGTGTFVQQMLLTGKHYSDENVTMEVEYRQKVAASSTSYGLSIGKKSSNTISGQKFSIGTYYGNGTSNVISFYNIEAGSVIGSQTVYTPVAQINDVLRVVYSQRASVYTGTIQNMTRAGAAPLTTSIYYSNSTAASFSPVNTGQPAIFMNGGTVEILSIKCYSTSIKRPAYMFIGDSKTARIYAGSNDGAFANLVGAYYNKPMVLLAGGSDQTKDILLSIDNMLAYCVPDNAFVCIGRNDLSQSVPLATIMANYGQIVSKLKAKGVRVIHLLPLPETVQDQSTLKAAIIAAYPNDAMVDVTTGWDNTTMLSTDNVHPNTDGNRFIAKKIIDSGLLLNKIVVPDEYRSAGSGNYGLAA